MTTYEKCKGIRRIIINRAAEIMAYDSWSNDFCAKKIKEIPSVLKDENGNLINDIQPSDLTEEEMKDLGFGKFSEESQDMLIPLWLFPFLAEEITTQCIDGSIKIKKSEMDNDNRFGCLAYGVYPKNT